MTLMQPIGFIQTQFLEVDNEAGNTSEKIMISNR